MQSPHPFLFDIGNVLCLFDLTPLNAALRDRSANAGGDLVRRVAEAKDAYESGEFGDQQFVAHVCETVGFRGDHDEFVYLWTDIFTANGAMFRTVEALAAAGHPLYLLSNTNGLHLDYLRRTYPVFRHFAGGVYSHEAKAAKPGERIFEIAFEQFSINPREAYYIDDLPANIETGRRLGLTAHLYEPSDHAACERWLKDLGVAGASGR